MPEVDYAILSEWYDWIQANEDMHVDLIGENNTSCDVRIPVSSDFNPVQHKPACTVTEKS